MDAIYEACLEESDDNQIQIQNELGRAWGGHRPRVLSFIQQGYALPM